MKIITTLVYPPIPDRRFELNAIAYAVTAILEEKRLAKAKGAPMKTTLKIQEVAYHRNGVKGNGFHAVRFSDKIDGKRLDFLATVFEEPGNIAVICLDLIAEYGIKDHVNSWRGDQYEVELRAAIKANDEENEPS